MRLRILLVIALVSIASVASLPAATAAGRTRWAQGWYAADAVYRPHMLMVTGDGSEFVRKMAWGHWGSLRARGHGIAWVDDCMPNCAGGTYHKYPVSVRLSKPRRICGKRLFTRLVVVYTDGHPKGTSRVWAPDYYIAC